MKHAPVSVVIPTYNNGPFITEAIDSALAQTLPPKEIIVIDDGSRDDTHQRLAPYRDRICHLFQENKGVSAARNRGLERASGEFIAFLDADDVWHPRKLEWQLAALEQLPELALIGTATFSWPGTTPGIPDEPARAHSLAMVPREWLVVKNYFTTSSIVVRRAVLDRVGGFDRQLQGPEDYDLWLRIAAVAPVANLRQALTGYRSVAGSLSRQTTTMETGMRRILDKLAATPCPWWLRRKANSYCEYSCAYMHAAAGNRWIALCRLLSSMAWYPWPYRRHEVRMPFARPRMMAVLLRRLIGETYE